MKRFHLTFGLAIVIVFLLTGQYMEYVRNRQLPDGTRMLYRSRHIYLLLAGLLNLGIGTYFRSRPSGWRRKLQITGSVLIALAPVLLLADSFGNHKRDRNRQRSRRSESSRSRLARCSTSLAEQERRKFANRILNDKRSTARTND